MKASELKKGMMIRDGSDIYAVVEIEHRTPGNLRAIYQTTIKNIVTGKILNKRYSPTDVVEKVDLDARKMQYLYQDGSGLHFMDMSTYETVALSLEMVGSARFYLRENSEIEILYYNHTPVSIELPPNVKLKVKETSVAVRGDTSGKVMKSATLETGLNVNVPIFIEEGEIIVVDTRSGAYLGRG